MAEKQKELIAEFEFRMRQLMFLCDSLKEQNEKYREQLKQKDEFISSLSAQFEQLEKQYDNLKFAKSFSSDNKEEILDAKQRLSRLVRDVEKCIALLKM